MRQIAKGLAVLFITAVFWFFTGTSIALLIVETDRIILLILGVNVLVWGLGALLVTLCIAFAIGEEQERQRALDMADTGEREE